MKTGTACNRTVFCVDGNESAREASRLMREHHVGDLVITREERGRRVPVGLVTDRDLVLEVLAQDIDPEMVTVGDLFTGPRLITAAVDEDLEDTVHSMRSHGVRRVPVVDKDGALVGIITMDDMLGLMAGQLLDVTRLISRQTEIEVERRQA
ncbi:MAG: CBS domain-containing protein [Gammaproteobacteria bacterium]|nr:MAG: CBS domain-containing protein [Gammaproteobacteria bacterium]